MRCEHDYNDHNNCPKCADMKSMTNPTDSDTTDKACGFDEMAAQIKGQSLAFRAPHNQVFNPDESVDQQINSFIDGARWQHSQDQAEAQSMKQLREENERLKTEMNERTIEQAKFSSAIAPDMTELIKLRSSSRVMREEIIRAHKRYLNADPYCEVISDLKQALESAGVGK